MKKIPLFFLMGAAGVVALLVSINAARGEYRCDWALDAQGWYYYFDEPNGVGDLMEHQATGGQSGGYVRCPLNELTDWEPTPDVYYPAYAWGWLETTSPSRPLNPGDLNEGALIDVYVKNDSSPLGQNPFNLYGGQLYFFIGEWTDPDGPGGNPESWTFYRSVEAFDINITDQWRRTGLDLSSDSAWTLLTNQGTPKPLHQLMDTPQQWGFAILGASQEPTGYLAFDTLSIVPEPSAISLLVLGAAGFLLFGRWRKNMRKIE